MEGKEGLNGNKPETQQSQTEIDMGTVALLETMTAITPKGERVYPSVAAFWAD